MEQMRTLLKGESLEALEDVMAGDEDDEIGEAVVAADEDDFMEIGRAGRVLAKAQPRKRSGPAHEGGGKKARRDGPWWQALLGIQEVDPEDEGVVVAQEDGTMAVEETAVVPEETQPLEDIEAAPVRVVEEGGASSSRGPEVLRRPAAAARRTTSEYLIEGVYLMPDGHGQHGQGGVLSTSQGALSVPSELYNVEGVVRCLRSTEWPGRR